MTVIDHANAKLLAIACEALRHHAADLLELGATFSEANLALESYRSDLERWRKGSLKRLERHLDEPAAPSVELH